MSHEERNSIMFFPGKYKKPVLQSIIEASQCGWNATCGGGATPGTGGDFCPAGGSAGVSKGGFDGTPYTNPDNSSRLLNPEDVNSGL